MHTNTMPECPCIHCCCCCCCGPNNKSSSEQPASLQLRLRLPIFSSFISTIVLLYLTRLSSCRSWQATWQGILPLYNASTSSALCWLWLVMPRSPSKAAPVLQVSCILTCRCNASSMRPAC